MKSVCMWIGFVVAVISYYFIGNELFPTPPDGSYPLERAIGAGVTGAVGAFIGSLVDRLLAGASGDSA